MGCFNDPARRAREDSTRTEVCVWWVGWVADTNYPYPARWGWINKKNELIIEDNQPCFSLFLLLLYLFLIFESTVYIEWKQQDFIHCVFINLFMWRNVPEMGEGSTNKHDDDDINLH